MTAFSELGIMPEIIQAIEEQDWLLPTDVQAEAIPLILGGGDVLMAAETGSGKTGAFSLPVIQITYESIRDQKMGKPHASTTTYSNKVLLNAYDRGDTFAIAPDGLLCQSRDYKQWNGCRSNLGANEGKCYYEATVTDEGLCRVGWSTQSATLELGKDRFGFGYGGTGKKSWNSQFDDYGQAFGRGDTIGCYIDLVNGQIHFSKNDKKLGKAFDIPKELKGEIFYASVVLKNAEMKFNFGDSNFSFPPEEYTPLSKAKNLLSITTAAKPTKAKSQRTPLAIIIEPARELAQQTHDNIKQFKKYIPSPGVRELLVMGGESVKDQIRGLQEGVDIVIGTPGRLDDLISTGKLDLSSVRFFILDEADGLLTQGYSDLINKIYSKIPKVSPEGHRLQMIVCSATLHNIEVKKLATRLMHFPTWIDLKGQDSVPETVHHVICYVDPVTDNSWSALTNSIQTDGVHHNKGASNKSPEGLSEAVKLLKISYLIKAINSHNMDQAIIFCRTKLDCNNVENHLIKLGGVVNFNVIINMDNRV